MKEPVKASGLMGGNWSGFTAGESSASGAVVQGGNARGNTDGVQAGNSLVAQPEPEGVVQSGEQYGEPDGIELHVVVFKGVF